MLSIRNLHVSVQGKKILRGIDLEVRAGEVHAVMGPNGSGKSTLTQVLAGRKDYEVTQGTVCFQGKNLLSMKPEERAREGIFLAFQYPVEIPGVGNLHFIRLALNQVLKHQGKLELDAMDFLSLSKSRMELLGIGKELNERSVNAGFSGGEKKRNEVFQMSILEPKLAILDEIDSGLDIDALKNVANGINALRSQERTFLVVTHYQRLLDYVIPDRVHVLNSGRIVESGDKRLALTLEKQGYQGIGTVQR